MNISDLNNEENSLEEKTIDNLDANHTVFNVFFGLFIMFATLAYIPVLFFTVKENSSGAITASILAIIIGCAFGGSVARNHFWGFFQLLIALALAISIVYYWQPSFLPGLSAEMIGTQWVFALGVFVGILIRSMFFNSFKKTSDAIES